MPAQFPTTTDQRWKWAGIVSVVSICGVLVTEIVANIVGGYISDQIMDWQPPQTEGMTASVAFRRPAETVITAVPVRATKGALPEVPTTVAPPAPLPAEEVETEVIEPELPAVTGKVQKVIDTATLRIEGNTVPLAGITGFKSPYSDQLAKFIEEQGGKLSCSPDGKRYRCFVKNIDIGLAALTNGAARLGTDATPQYHRAEAEARRNRRGVFQ